eukprot:7268020-Prymnesium_polylepis.1
MRNSHLGKVFAIVTELLNGGSFGSKVRAGMDMQQLGNLAGETASALAYMHANRMQHRWGHDSNNSNRRHAHNRATSPQHSLTC